MKVEFFVGIEKTYIETESKDIREIVQTAVDFAIANQSIMYPPDYSAPPELFTVREVCDLIDVSKTKVHDLIRTGVLISEIRDQLIHIHNDSLRKWVRESGREMRKKPTSPFDKNYEILRTKLL